MTIEITDRIGDRLDHPELVPPELRHLIPDDQQRVKRILEFEISGDALEVGCSDGAINRRIQRQWPQATVWGCDLHPMDAHTPMWYLQWDARQPWLFDGIRSFSTIFACEFFEHLTDADAGRALTNILAILKPDGQLIVTVPNRDCDERYVAGCRDRWRWPDHRSVWWPAKLQRFLKGTFEDIQWHALYPDDIPWESIFLIARARGRR